MHGGSYSLSPPHIQVPPRSSNPRLYFFSRILATKRPKVWRLRSRRTPGPADWTCRAPNPGVLLFSEILSGTGHLLHSWPNPCLMLTGPQLGCSGSMPCRGFQIGPLVGLAVLLADSIITSSAKRGWHILCIRQPTMQYRALRIWSELCRSISDPNYDSLGRRSLPWKLHVLCPSVSIRSSDPAPSAG